MATPIRIRIRQRLFPAMSRGGDGKAVDVDRIQAVISDKRAGLGEDPLWNPVPEASHLQEQVGRDSAANGEYVGYRLVPRPPRVGGRGVGATADERAI